MMSDENLPAEFRKVRGNIIKPRQILDCEKIETEELVGSFDLDKLEDLESDGEVGQVVVVEDTDGNLHMVNVEDIATNATEGYLEAQGDGSVSFTEVASPTLETEEGNYSVSDETTDTTTITFDNTYKHGALSAGFSGGGHGEFDRPNHYAGFAGFNRDGNGNIESADIYHVTHDGSTVEWAMFGEVAE